MMTQLILVGAGGFLGAIARFSVSEWVNRWLPSRVPYGTLIVNLLGSFLLGMLFGVAHGTSWYLLAGTGFMGAFTTFSTFNTENIELYNQNEIKTLLAYLAVSYVGGILLAFFGLIIGLP